MQFTRHRGPERADLGEYLRLCAPRTASDGLAHGQPVLVDEVAQIIQAGGFVEDEGGPGGACGSISAVPAAATCSGCGPKLLLLLLLRRRR